jgi:hypothetical protein
MRCLVFILLCLLQAGISTAQNGHASLLLQSPDGQSVRLIWFLKDWQKGITGFDLKRREGRGDWTSLNKASIQPEITRNKDLSIVQSDPAEQTRLKAKLTKMIGDKKLKEINNDAYIEKLNADKDAIKGVALMTALDYDVALMNGFAFVDNAPGKKKYEYGVFSTGSSTPLATASWSGETPDLDLITQVSSKRAGTSKAQIVWTVDTIKMKKEYVAGFYIYRNGQKLNQTPVLASSNKEASAFTWFDSLAAKAATSSYSIVPVTLFNIEGKAKDYTYDPSKFPTSYQAAEIQQISAKANGADKGVKLTWTMPEKDKAFILGYYIERNYMPKGFQKLGQFLPATALEYQDALLPEPGAYTSYKVTVLYNDSTVVQSGEKMFVYFPDTKPDAPQHVQAKWTKEGNKLYADLSWDATRPGDDLIDYYQIYASDPFDGRMYLQSGIPPIKGNSYRYELKYEQASRYKFLVAAVSKYKIEGLKSDTASVLVPSQKLPIPAVKKLTVTDSNKVLIQWDYAAPWDLKGFRLYQNGNLVRGELEINKNTRQITTPGLKWNANYNFSIQAVTEQGVTSLVSVPASITVYSDSKQ